VGPVEVGGRNPQMHTDETPMNTEDEQVPQADKGIGMRMNRRKVGAVVAIVVVLVALGPLGQFLPFGRLLLAIMLIKETCCLKVSRTSKR